MKFIFNKKNIMNNGYYITSSGEKHILLPHISLSLQRKNIVELVIPEGAVNVYCEYNKIKKLDLPKNAKTVRCINNNIYNIKLNSDIKELNCANNSITELIIPLKM